MTYDAAVIGAGPGGYECALKIAAKGGKVIVFERDLVGGVCTNRGCIPTKTLAESANLVDKIASASSFGVEVELSGIDNIKLLKRRDRVSMILRKGVEKLLSDAGVELVYSEAEIVSAKKVMAKGKSYGVKNIVVATGSVACGVGSLELDHEFVISGDDAATSHKLPTKVVIIGAGFIGCEYAAIYGSLGCDVTLIEAEDRLLPQEDKMISELLEQVLSKRVAIRTSARVEAIDADEKIVSCANESFSCDLVLLAVGRKPVYPKGLGSVGVKFEAQGIPVDVQMKTNVNGIYAIGDVTTHQQLAHAAYEAAKVAADNILGGTSSIDYSTLPRCVFTQPEVGRVGVTEEDAPEGALIGVASYLANGKARCMGEKFGFAKVIVDKESHTLLAAHIMGARASDLIGEATLAVKNRITAEQIIATIHPHPTLCELLKSACVDALS